MSTKKTDLDEGPVLVVDKAGKHLSVADVQPKPKEQPLRVIPEQTPMAFIAAAIAQDMDVDKLEKLMDLQERYENRNAQKQFIQAMAEFQAICPSVFRSRESDKHSYAPLETIIAAIRPALQKTGLSVRFDSEITENSVTAICKVSHAGGHTEASSFTCPVEKLTSKAGNRIMNDAQALASASSYAKRYAVKNAFNIVESYEDDDAEGLNQTITPKQAASLRDELAAMDSDEAYFCKWLKVKSLEEITEKMLPRVQKAIAERKAQQK